MPPPLFFFPPPSEHNVKEAGPLFLSTRCNSGSRVVPRRAVTSRSSFLLPPPEDYGTSGPPPPPSFAVRSKRDGYRPRSGSLRPRFSFLFSSVFVALAQGTCWRWRLAFSLLFFLRNLGAGGAELLIRELRPSSSGHNSDFSPPFSHPRGGGSFAVFFPLRWRTPFFPPPPFSVWVPEHAGALPPSLGIWKWNSFLFSPPVFPPRGSAQGRLFPFPLDYHIGFEIAAPLFSSS